MISSFLTAIGWITCIYIMLTAFSTAEKKVYSYDKSGNCILIVSENTTRGEWESKLGSDGITRWFEVNYDNIDDRVVVKVDLNAEENDEAAFQVFDSGGRLLSSGAAVSGEISYVSMCDYPKGVYVVTLVCGQRRESAVFVK